MEVSRVLAAEAAVRVPEARRAAEVARAPAAEVAVRVPVAKKALAEARALAAEVAVSRVLAVARAPEAEAAVRVPGARRVAAVAQELAAADLQGEQAGRGAVRADRQEAGGRRAVAPVALREVVAAQAAVPVVRPEVAELRVADRPAVAVNRQAEALEAADR